jgi:hypothetical protein
MASQLHMAQHAWRRTHHSGTGPRLDAAQCHRSHTTSPGNRHWFRGPGWQHGDQYRPYDDNRRSRVEPGHFGDGVPPGNCKRNTAHRRPCRRPGQDRSDGGIRRRGRATRYIGPDRPGSGRPDPYPWRLSLRLFGSADRHPYARRWGRPQCRLHLPDWEHAHYGEQLRGVNHQRRTLRSLLAGR